MNRVCWEIHFLLSPRERRVEAFSRRADRERRHSNDKHRRTIPGGGGRGGGGKLQLPAADIV